MLFRSYIAKSNCQVRCTESRHSPMTTTGDRFSELVPRPRCNVRYNLLLLLLTSHLSNFHCFCFGSWKISQACHDSFQTSEGKGSRFLGLAREQDPGGRITAVKWIYYPYVDVGCSRYLILPVGWEHLVPLWGQYRPKPHAIRYHLVVEANDSTK